VSVAQKMTQEMGLNLAEFSRSIVGAVKPHSYTVDGRVFTIQHPEGQIDITLGETKVRRIALLALPVTFVKFDFGSVGEASRVLFMERFDRYFHRGGG